MIKRFLKGLSQSEFFRGVLTLSSGTAIAQSIPVLITPILTRLYSPEQFATFGLFAALIGIFGTISTGKYEFAILLPEDNKEAQAIASLSGMIAVSFSLLSLAGVAVFHTEIVSFFNNPDLGFWIYFVPLGIALMGIFQVLNFLNNRQKAYPNIAKSRIARSIVTAITNVSMGSFRVSYKLIQSMGLVLGLLLGQSVEIFLLLRKQKEWRMRFNRDILRKVANRYINFPKFDVPSELMITASIQLPVLLFNKFFEKSVVGFYYHAHRVLSIPMTMLGSAVGQVLFRQLSDCRNDQDTFSALVVKTYSNLILVAVIPYSLLGFFGQEIFSLVFGKPWAESGVYAQLISPWLLFNFVGAPLTMIFSVLEKQRRMFFWIVTMFLLRVISILLGIFIFRDTYHTVLLFSISGMVFYFSLNLYLVCFLSAVKLKDFIKSTFGWPLLIVALIGASRIIFNNFV